MTKLPTAAARGLIDRSVMRGGAPAVIHGGALLRQALEQLAHVSQAAEGRVAYTGLDEEAREPWSVEVYDAVEGASARLAELGEEPPRIGGRRVGAGRPKGATDKALDDVVKLRADAALLARIDALRRPGETRSDVLRAGLVALAELRGR